MSGLKSYKLLATACSYVSYGRSQCPLLKNNVNYQQLQEMAKDIPEEDGNEEQPNNNHSQNFEEPTKDLPVIV